MDCEMLEWINVVPPNQRNRDPPADTIAIVADATGRSGAIRIFEAGSNEFLGGVGTEYAGYVIVPWNSRWYYSCVGTLRVAYMVKKRV